MLTISVGLSVKYSNSQFLLVFICRSRSDLQETVIKLERKVAHQQEIIQKLESEKDQLTEKCKEAAEQNQALLSQHTKALSAVLKILNPEHFKDTTDGSDDSDEIVSTELVVAQVKEKMALLEEQANRKHPKVLVGVVRLMLLVLM